MPFMRERAMRAARSREITPYVWMHPDEER